ncbi:MAG: hypothetical protein AAFX95_14945 [Cyanobacteria bacterium J06639_16]
MLSANTLKHAALLAGLTTLIGWSSKQLPYAQAATFVFDNWNRVGDVLVQDENVGLSNNGLLGEDGDAATDAAVNFSGERAVDINTLETELGLPSMALNLPDFDAYEGSGLYTELVITEPTTFSFDWVFFTNENFFVPVFPDYAFISINQSITSIANAFEPLVSSPLGYQYQRMGSFSQSLDIGTYNLAIGVVDVGDVAVSSGLAIMNAEFTPPIVDGGNGGGGNGGGNGNGGGGNGGGGNGGGNGGGGNGGGGNGGGNGGNGGGNGGGGPVVSIPEPSAILGHGLIGVIGVAGSLMRKSNCNKATNPKK